jgi:hypothetical protein
MHGAALENVGAHHPQECLAGELEPQGELLKLASVKHREAAKGDVHDGSSRLRVKPGHALLVLWLPEVADGFASALAGEERADGKNVGEERESCRLCVLKGVADDKVAMFDCADAPVEALKEGRLLVMVANAVPCEVSAVHGRHARAQLESFFAQCSPFKDELINQEMLRKEERDMTNSSKCLEKK